MPFTADQFMDVFKSYNLSVWPGQIFLNLIALFAIIFAIKKYHYADRIDTGILGFLWLWTGVVYQIIFFTSINNAAYIFGALFIIQAFVFIYSGIVKKTLSFNFHMNSFGITGAV